MVVLDKACNVTACMPHIQRCFWADPAGFERFVPAFNFAVGLGVVRGGFDLDQPWKANEVLEVLCSKLRAVVGDGSSPWRMEQGRGSTLATLADQQQAGRIPGPCFGRPVDAGRHRTPRVLHSDTP